MGFPYLHPALDIVSTASAVPTWEPTQLTGTKRFWYKSDTQVYSDAAGTVPVVADAENIGSHKGQYTATLIIQNTAGKRPNWETNEINSLPAIRFNSGSSDTLFVTGLSLARASYIFGCVFKLNDASGTRTLINIISTNSLNMDISGGNLRFSDGANVLSTPADTSWHYLTAYHTGADLFVRVDGTQIGTANFTRFSENITALVVGSFQNTSGFISADWAELILGTKTSGGFDLTEVEDMESYLAYRYNL